MSLCLINPFYGRLIDDLPFKKNIGCISSRFDALCYVPGLIDAVLFPKSGCAWLRTMLNDTLKGQANANIRYMHFLCIPRLWHLSSDSLLCPAKANLGINCDASWGGKRCCCLAVPPAGG